MLKKIGLSLLIIVMLLGACAKKPEFINDNKNQTAIVERPAISEIKQLSDLKKMIENEINSGKGFSYSETISVDGASIFSFYREDSMKHRSFRQSVVMQDQSSLIKYEIEDAGKFSSYDVDLKKFKDTSSAELDNVARSVRLQLLDYLRDDLQMEITEQTEAVLKIDVSGIAIEDAGTVFNRMNISYLAADKGVVVFFLFSDSGTSMGFTVSFAEEGFDIGDSLKDVQAIEGE